MTPQKLSYWRRVLGPGQGPAPASFVPVHLVDRPAIKVDGSVEIVSKDWRIIVGDGVSRELLRDILAVLREAC